jgi:hypothetical protein
MDANTKTNFNCNRTLKIMLRMDKCVIVLRDYVEK